MPNYDYTCKACDQTVTVTRSINDPVKVPGCLKCQAPMARVYTAPPIVFKGGDFNATNG